MSGKGTIRRERIVSDPAIMVGKPTIKGTRITVELVLDYLDDGGTVDELIMDYPHLVREDVRAVLRLRFATGSTRS